MVYRLPVVTMETLRQLEREFLVPGMSDELALTYVRDPKRENPNLMLPIGDDRFSDPTREDVQIVLTSTVRQLEIQAEKDGTTLPRVTKGTIDEFCNSCTPRDLVNLFRRYDEENNILSRKVVGYVAECHEQARDHLVNLYVLTLRHLEAEGRKRDKPRKRR